MPAGMYDHPRRHYPDDLVERIRVRYGDGETQREIASTLGLTQKVVWRVMRNHGLHARVAAKRKQYGVQNATWRGDHVGYAGAHARVKALRGQPPACERCGTTDPQKCYDWANMTGHYADPSDYRRFCRSCHWKFDRKIENIRKGRKEACP